MMESAHLETLLEKVKTIAQGPHAGLLNKLVDLLYEREMEGPEYFSPEEIHSLIQGV
jgi:hypothetical protein